MAITAYLKEIARGKDGARALDATRAEDLLRQIYAGEASDVQVGAFLIAMRIKGESAQELAGFLAATRACIAPSIAEALRRSEDAPRVWLPSYNGARKLPNLTGLLAGLLAREGLAVVVHGPALDPLRVTSHAVFAALGWPIVESDADAGAIASAGAARRPVFVTTDALCPPLARLLALRWQVGLRSAGHTVAKLLSPATGDGAPRALRVVNHTHPEYATSLADFLIASKADALLLRGTEGEPVADARRTPRMDAFVGGARVEALSVPAEGGVLARLPHLPAAIDAKATAAFIDATLAGSLPLPPPLQAQVDALAAMARHIHHDPEHAA
ncbi:MAG: DNA-binding protein YbiB [Rubrivivax sp.]